MTKFLHNKRLKENKFVVPNGYFNRFEDNLFRELGIEKPDNRRSRHVTPIFYSLTAVAASMLLLVGLVWFLRSSPNNYNSWTSELLLTGYDVNILFYENNIDTDYWDLNTNSMVMELDEPTLISMLNNSSK